MEMALVRLKPLQQQLQPLQALQPLQPLQPATDRKKAKNETDKRKRNQNLVIHFVL